MARGIVRSSSKQFVKLTYQQLDDPRFYNLSSSAIRAYIYLRRQRNKLRRGKIINNSDDYIEYGFSDCPGLSKRTFVRAITELRTQKMIKLIKPGKFPKIKAVYEVL